MNRKKAHLRRTISCVAATALVILFAPACAASAQESDGGASFRHETFAGSTPESYLRYLQTVGLVPLYPWSSRAFSQQEIRRLIPRDTAHPWRERFVETGRTVRGFRYGFVQPAATLRFNSAFAYGSNDGPVWAGRGLTSAVQAGVFAEWGPVTLTLAPMMFRAENETFDIVPTGRPGVQVFGDPQFAGVDRPQRFGDGAYSQIDPGQSTLRVDFPFVAAGISTANQEWGPGQELPVILGNNAAGFPHLFVGTSEPLDLYIVKLHGKVIWGELFQSSYSSVSGPEYFASADEPGTKRFATGFVLTIQPRGLTGLELGASRFFHSIWPRSGIPGSYFTKFVEGLLKKRLPVVTDPELTTTGDDRSVADNQLLSVFGRWVLPHSGFEFHAEYGREDHSYDYRDLVQEPDHSRAYSLGARKVFQSGAEGLTAGRVEIMNFQLPQLSRYRGEGEIYVHGLIRQGHTFRGQLLGADVGVGTGAGSVAAVDHFSRGGRWTASWTRIVRRENGNFVELGIRSPRSIDVSHALGFEISRFMRGFDATGGLTLVRELNRDFRRDATNVNALLGVRYRWQ